MFLVNSRLGRFFATPSSLPSKLAHLSGALLLPKLRSHFAEFLNEGYLERLGILYLPTCVGFSTDTGLSGLEAFLGSVGSISSLPWQLPITSWV